MNLRLTIVVVLCCMMSALEVNAAAARRGASRGAPNAAMMQKFQQMQKQRAAASRARRAHQNQLSKLANQREKEMHEASERKHNEWVANHPAKDSKSDKPATNTTTGTSGTVSKDVKPADAKGAEDAKSST